MRSIYKLIIMLIINALFLSTYNSHTLKTNDKLTAAVSIIPQETFVKKVAGDLVDVITVIPPGKSPANYAPSPQDIEKLSHASIYFTIGVPSEQSSILPRLMDINNETDYMAVHNLMKQLGIFHLARALATEPRVLLLDEPTASIDTDSKAQIYRFLKDINRSITIVLVTHDIAAVSSYIKNIACLNKKLYYHGEPELANDVIENTFGCPFDLIAHGIPHRILKIHGE